MANSCFVLRRRCSPSCAAEVRSTSSPSTAASISLYGVPPQISAETTTFVSRRNRTATPGLTGAVLGTDRLDLGIDLFHRHRLEAGGLDGLSHAAQPAARRTAHPFLQP